MVQGRTPRKRALTVPRAFLLPSSHDSSPNPTGDCWKVVWSAPTQKSLKWVTMDNHYNNLRQKRINLFFIPSHIHPIERFYNKINYPGKDTLIIKCHWHRDAPNYEIPATTNLLGRISSSKKKFSKKLEFKEVKTTKKLNPKSILINILFCSVWTQWFFLFRSQSPHGLRGYIHYNCSHVSALFKSPKN